MRKDKMKKVEDGTENGTIRQMSGRKKMLVIAVTVLTAIVLFAFYRISLEYSFFPFVMWGYMLSLTVLIGVYVIINRGFWRNGLTVEMLPESWSDEEKRGYIESRDRRVKNSRWMLILIAGLLITFMLDALELFVLTQISDRF